MRDVLLYAHILIGALLILLPFIILSQLKAKNSAAKPLSFLTAGLSWILLIPAGKLYITFYPATKTVIKAGTKPWAHSIIMETKEHWGLLLPFIVTIATALVFKNEFKESKKWWALAFILSILLGLMGRIIKFGAMP